MRKTGAGPVAALVAVGVLLLGACGGGAGAPSPASREPGVVTIPTGINPAGIAIGGGYLWVANSGEGTVSKIDLRTDRPVARIRVGDPAGLVGCESGSIHQTPHGDFRIRNCDLPKAVAFGGGSVWAGKGDTKDLVRIDPRTGRILATVPLGVEAWYIYPTDLGIWVSDWRTDTVVRVDPATDRVVATIPDLPYGPTGMALAPGGLWVADSRASVVTRIDPATGRVVATVPVGPTPLPVVYAFGSVWVRNMNEGNGTVSRIDPETNRVLANVDVGPEAGRDGLDSMAVFRGGLWVSGLYLEKIDPARNQVVVKNRHTCNFVTVGAGALWTVDIAYSVSRIANP